MVALFFFRAWLCLFVFLILLLLGCAVFKKGDFILRQNLMARLIDFMFVNLLRLVGSFVFENYISNGTLSAPSFYKAFWMLQHHRFFSVFFIVFLFSSF